MVFWIGQARLIIVALCNLRTISLERGLDCCPVTCSDSGDPHTISGIMHGILPWDHGWCITILRLGPHTRSYHCRFPDRIAECMLDSMMDMAVCWSNLHRFVKSLWIILLILMRNMWILTYTPVEVFVDETCQFWMSPLHVISPFTNTYVITSRRYFSDDCYSRIC